MLAARQKLLKLCNALLICEKSLRNPPPAKKLPRSQGPKYWKLKDKITRLRQAKKEIKL